MPAGPALIQRENAWTLVNSKTGSSYNVTRGTIYAPSVHDWNSQTLTALPDDRCAAAATEDDVTSVVLVAEFVAPEYVGCCAAAALHEDVPVAAAPVGSASGAEFVPPMPAEFNVQLCLDELVPAATAACPAAELPDLWAGYTPGLASLDGYHSDSDEELWEYVEVEPWPMHDGLRMLQDEFVKEVEEKELLHDEFEAVQEEKARGGLLQVSPNLLSSGSSEKVRILFRVDGQLGLWNSGLQAGGKAEGCHGGYFATRGSKLLDCVPCEGAGRRFWWCWEGLQQRLPVPGELAPHFWPSKLFCYRCSAPRRDFIAGAGVGGQGCVPGVGFGGQGGVGSGLSSMRLVGPTGRDLSHVSTGDPSFRKGAGKASWKGVG